MPLPTQNDLLGIEFSLYGEPFVQYSTKASMDTLTLNYQLFGEPFIAIQGEPANYTPWAGCDNASIGLLAILKLLLIDCITCSNTSLGAMALIKGALVTDPEGRLYLKTNVACGLRAGPSGLSQLGIRVLYGAAGTEYAACDQADSLDSLAKRLITIGDDGLYYLNVV